MTATARRCSPRLAMWFVPWLAACGQASRDSSPSFGGESGTSSAVSGAAGQSGRAGGGGTAGALEPACFDVANAVRDCSEGNPGAHPVVPVELFAAEELMAGSQFSRLGGWAVLAESSEGRARIAVANPDALPLDTWDVDTNTSAGALRITGVWAEAEPLTNVSSNRVVALGCNASGCQLLGAKRGDRAVIVLPEYALPVGARLNGLVGGHGRLCAYGDGVYCLQSDTWQEELAQPIAGSITAVSLGPPAAAVNTAGTVFIEPDGGWTVQTVQTDSDVRARGIASSTGVISLQEEDGTWHALSISADAPVQCKQMPPLLLAIPGSFSGNPWLVVQGDGTVFQQQFPALDWCAVSHGANEPLVEAGKVTCRAATNLFAITEDAFLSLLGPIECFIR